jgi:molybdenum cofactor cytidylyltransferase
MKFVTVATENAEGGILAHAVRMPNFFLAKGLRLDSAALAQLRGAGVEKVAVALIEAGDVAEDRAAERAARHLVGPGIIAREPHAGRVNLCASVNGLLLFEPQGVHELNHIDEAITIATLPLHDVVEPGQVVATIKVNPYAVAEEIVAAWERTAKVFRVAQFRPHRASLIQTLAPGLKQSVLDKTSRATRERLEALGGVFVAEARPPHEDEALAAELRQRIAAGDDLILICGACSIADRNDVIPAAIVAAGGKIEHFGMPVDPGNLLLLGAVGEIPVIGMPGCARTPQLNGFDHVLRRVFAGLPMEREAIMNMGVGGLLKETPWRAEPRAAAKTGKDFSAGKRAAAPRIAALVLAAGQSSRMGENKLLLPLDGKPVLRHVVDAIRGSSVTSTTLVLGHQAEAVRALFEDAPVDFVVNEDYRLGLSTSLKKGLAALAPEVDGAMVFLGDMPDVDSALIDRMIGSFDPGQMRAIIVPKRGGRRGHPVLWGRGFFPILTEKMTGDIGAKAFIGQYAEWVAEIEADHDGVFTDLDTPEAFRARKQRERAGNEAPRREPRLSSVER